MQQERRISSSQIVQETRSPPATRTNENENNHSGTNAGGGGGASNNNQSHNNNPHHHHHHHQASGAGGYNNLHRQERRSSSESIPEATNEYTIRFRSLVGSFEDHISYGFSNLYSSPDFSDVTIACEGTLLKAHKLVLGLNSPYFKQMFEELQDYHCQRPVLILHGIKLRDWQNVMRFVYTGEVTINPNEIDDFISTMEGLKIDGLSEEQSSSMDDDASPYDYTGRFPAPEFQLTEDGASIHSERSVGRIAGHPVYSSSYSTEEFSRPRDYRYQRNNSPPLEDSNRGYGSDHEQAEQFENRKQSTSTESTKSQVVSASAQSSPGVTTQSSGSIREQEIETDLKIEKPEGNHSHRSHSSFDHHSRLPIQTDEIRAYSQPPSPVESRIKALRHPIICRQRSTTSESAAEEALELSMRSGSGGSYMSSSSRMVFATKTVRSSPYSSSWDSRAYSTTAESVSFEGSKQQYPSICIDQRSPTTTSASSFLSPLSRPPPLQLPSPGIPGYLSNRVTQLPLVPTSLSQSSTNTTVPQSSSPAHHQPSALAILKAKIAAGEPIYSRGYRYDRFHSGFSGPSSIVPAAMGSPREIHGNIPGSSSTSSLFSLPLLSSPNQLVMSRPKTKAIRSSQVPQSARYTAAEVDTMVDKVQNFPGNQVPCAVCQKFVKRERLRAHIHECHLLNGKRIECPYCGIGLKSKGSYRVHIWRHKKGTLPSRPPQQHRPLPEPDDHDHSNANNSQS